MFALSSPRNARGSLLEKLERGDQTFFGSAKTNRVARVAPLPCREVKGQGGSNHDVKPAVFAWSKVALG